MQMMQMHGTFEGFPFEKSALIELVIFHDPWINTFNQEAMGHHFEQRNCHFFLAWMMIILLMEEIRLTS